MRLPGGGREHFRSRGPLPDRLKRTATERGALTSWRLRIDGRAGLGDKDVQDGRAVFKSFDSVADQLLQSALASMCLFPRMDRSPLA